MLGGGNDEDDDEIDDVLDHQDYDGNIFNMADEFAGIPSSNHFNIN